MRSRWRQIEGVGHLGNRGKDSRLPRNLTIFIFPRAFHIIFLSGYRSHQIWYVARPILLWRWKWAINSRQVLGVLLCDRVLFLSPPKCENGRGGDFGRPFQRVPFCAPYSRVTTLPLRERRKGRFLPHSKRTYTLFVNEIRRHERKTKPLFIQTSKIVRSSLLNPLQ